MKSLVYAPIANAHPIEITTAEITTTELTVVKVVAVNVATDEKLETTCTYLFVEKIKADYNFVVL